jgi:hypothetical protein
MARRDAGRAERAGSAIGASALFAFSSVFIGG